MRLFTRPRLSTALMAAAWLLGPALLLGCVTINVYFPEAAAQKAAAGFIGDVLDTPAAPAPAPARSAPPPTSAKGGPSAALLDLLIPAATAADAPNLRIQTPVTMAIQQRMRARYAQTLVPALDAGAIGFTQDGLVAVRDLGALPPAQRTAVAAAVSAENADRNALYREVAQANGHPEWEPQIRATFARGWIEQAKPGWYHQDAAGRWTRS